MFPHVPVGYPCVHWRPCLLRILGKFTKVTFFYKLRKCDVICLNYIQKIDGQTVSTHTHSHVAGCWLIRPSPFTEESHKSQAETRGRRRSRSRRRRRRLEGGQEARMVCEIHSENEKKKSHSYTHLHFFSGGKLFYLPG